MGQLTTDNSLADSSLMTALAALPAIMLGARDAWVREPDGRIATMPVPQARQRLAKAPHLLCHHKAMARRLNIQAVEGYDLLELFAFIRPAQFCLPTVKGLAAAATF